MTSPLIKYLDGRYQERLEEIKADFQRVTTEFIAEKGMDAVGVDFLRKLLMMYNAFTTNTCLHVQPLKGGSHQLDSKHCEMVTEEYIVNYIGNPLLTATIHQLKKGGKES